MPTEEWTREQAPGTRLPKHGPAGRRWPGGALSPQSWGRRAAISCIEPSHGPETGRRRRGGRRIDRPAVTVSEKASFGERNRSLRGDDHMVEDADIDQGQGTLQALGDAEIRLARLGYAGGVAVRED